MGRLPVEVRCSLFSRVIYWLYSVTDNVRYLNKVHPSDDASLGMRTQIADKPNWQPVCEPPTESPVASKSNVVVEAVVMGVADKE